MHLELLRPKKAVQSDFPKSFLQLGPQTPSNNYPQAQDKVSIAQVIKTFICGHIIHGDSRLRLEQSRRKHRFEI